MIDELRKKRFLEKLSGKETPEFKMEEIGIEGEYADNDDLIKNADDALMSGKSRQEREAGNVNGDLWVGASNALLGMLTGNHNRTVMGFDKGNKYVADRRAEDRKDLSSLVKTNQGGKPIYTPTIEAADMEAYVAPSKVGANGAAGSFQLAQIYDPISDKYLSVKHNSRSGELQDLNGNPYTAPQGAVIKPVAPRLYKTEDIGGTVTNKEKNPYKPGPKSFDSTGGLGPFYNVPTVGQGKNIESAQERGQKESEAISGSIVDAKSSEDTIRNSSDPRAISAAIYSLVRSVEPKGVLTEQDFQVISGNSFLPTLEEINQFIAKKGTGELSGVKASYLGLAKDIRKRLQIRLDSVPSRFGPTGNLKAKKGIENTVPKARKATVKNKAAYIQAETAAKRRWGPKSGTPRPELLENYLEQKKMDLGIE